MQENGFAFSIEPVATNSIRPNIAVGPQHPRNANRDLIPVLTKTIAILTAGATALRNRGTIQDREQEAVRQLIVATSFLAAGEARAVVALVTIALPMQARIHVRSVDEMLRRIAVYFKDHALAMTVFTSADAFRADGLRKLTPTDRADLEQRDEKVAERISQLAQSELKPPRITEHPSYGRQTAGLTSFDRWAYSQVEHGTLIGLAEMAKQVGDVVDIDLVYGTGDAALLLAATVGMLQNIILFLIASGIDVGSEFDEVVARMDALIEVDSVRVSWNE